jgi:hypothetical protein
MQLINLSLKNNHIDISIYHSVLNENIYNNKIFLELISLVEKHPNKYIYSFYTETCLIKDNIYIPVFHTLYLSCKHHNVIINSEQDFWLQQIFPNNTYYFITDQYDNSKKLDNNILCIRSISEIGNNYAI